MATRLAGLAGTLKIGSQLFTSEGPAAVRKLAKLGAGIFLDLKFHDIPNTVLGAVAAAAKLPGLRLMTLHATGGVEMMRAAARAVREAGLPAARRPKLLAVTILTSLDAVAMRKAGIQGSPAAGALRLAKLAREAGMDGAVASAHEVAAIRRACGKGFLIVVGGVRPGDARHRRRDDQARVATPGEAIRAGADFVVVGRPITAAPDPRAAAHAILEEIRRAEHQRV